MDSPVMTAEVLSPDFVTKARQALALHAKGDLITAKTLCVELIAMGPPQRDVSHLMGIIQLELGDAADALRHLDQADALQPGDAEVC